MLVKVDVHDKSGQVRPAAYFFFALFSVSKSTRPLHADGIIVFVAVAASWRLFLPFTVREPVSFVFFLLGGFLLSSCRECQLEE